MIALIGLLSIVTLSITAVRIGGIAFELTGLSHDVASFQAQSAFSGVGFTTSESESIVTHPVRRRIARILMLFGSAGITTTIATFILTFVGQRGEELIFRGGIMVAGLAVIFVLSKSEILHRFMKRVIIRALKRTKALQLEDYQELLGLSKGYSISRMVVKVNNWVLGRKLKDLRLHEEGTLVLSIHRNQNGGPKFIVPSGETTIERGDVLTLYGRCENCQCLSDRSKGHEGDEAHKKRRQIEKNMAQIREVSGEPV